MKFFTPELILRGGSLDDAEGDRAETHWDQAVDAYERELAGFRADLPADVLEFLDAYNLHDARVVLFALSEDDQTAELCVQPVAQGSPLLSLTYTLAKAARVISHSELAEPAAPLEWLYDEVGLLPGGPPNIFFHDILFTSGDEVRLAFLRLRLVRLHAVPAFRPAAAPTC